MATSTCNQHEQFALAQKAFSEYFATIVKPRLGRLDAELNWMDFSQTAKLIRDTGIRSQYRARAIRLLEASISCSAPNAQPMARSTYNTAFRAATTFLVFVLAYRLGPGVLPALLAAAIWYGYVAGEYRDGQEAADKHDKQAREWAEKIAAWEADLLTLKALE
ncbi:hypothetical protein [Paraburkholderia phytofirmans]|uniref:Uncharacterized protein n=1 Tax=Paraburkholderia phytofirmans OLGA172 TaxID=1417228 RepID=A0A160FKA7_9BURK|nr:hypothetical protein [Paraburkholderia phytofirmans]ANB72849.1 hypothetical protein AYM40_11065 [Paraburkholderia phytofirmans OLGA172]